MKAAVKKPVCKQSLKILGDYWTMLIIDRLAGGALRFRDLEAQVDDCNTATLTARLKRMQLCGLVMRREQSRADVRYELTELGLRAVPILRAVNHFSSYAEKSGNLKVAE